MGPVLSLVAIVWIAGCSSDDSASELAAALTRDKIVLVVMGGNTSCGTDGAGQPSPLATTLYAPFRQILDELERENGDDPRFVISCHTSDSTLHFVTSEDPGTIKSAPIEQTTSIVDRLAGEDGRLFIAGHSYGGWLALKTALSVSAPIDGLTTIDPISRRNCSIVSPLGCTSFPSDVTPADRAEIARRTRRWANFYQTQTWYLHAAPTPEADANIQIAMPHVGIETTADVWVEIAAQIDLQLIQKFAQTPASTVAF